MPSSLIACESSDMTSQNPYRPQRIGNLNRRLWLQHRTIIVGDFNEHHEVWRNEARIWCRLEPLKGEERFAAGGIEDTARALIHLRFRAGINPADHRIIDGTTEQQGEPYEDEPQEGAVVYNITSVRNLDERNAYLALDVAGARVT